MTEAHHAISLLRKIFEKQPKVKGYKVPDSLESETIWKY